MPNAIEKFLPSEVNLKERRKVFTTVEYEAVDIPLSDLIIDGEMSIYPQIADGDFLRVYAKRDKLVFQTGGYMGLIPINDRVVLDVKTRVPVKNLERMLLKAQHAPRQLDFYERSYSLHEEVIPSLIDILADALINGLQDIRINGVHREYLPNRQDTSFPKGRILMGETFQRHLLRGKNHSVAASWHEPSTDIAANRCIKYAIWYLSEKYRLMTPKKGWLQRLLSLNNFYKMFEKVKLDHSKKFLSDRFVENPELLPSIRRYYDHPLRIAKAVVEDRGISLDRAGDDILLPSLVMKIEDIFERYMLEVLQDLGSEYLPNLEILDGNKMPPNGGAKLLFDAAPSEKANPDIVFQYNGVADSSFPLVIDVKYKPADSPSREDLNQIISYGCSYRSPNVLLLYPSKGRVKGLKLEGQIDKMKVYTYRIDLASGDPAGEERLAFDTLLGLIPEIEKPVD